MAKGESPSNPHGSPSYTLTNAQRRYLKTGDPGTDTSSNMEARIQDKVDHLGDRIDHLLADVNLLYSKEYLTEESWKDAWAGLMGFASSPVEPETRRKWIREHADSADSPSESDVADACRASSPDSIRRPISAPTEFGRDLGKFAQQLMLAPGDVEHDEVLQELAYGFIEGLYVDHRPAGLGYQRPEQRRKHIDEIVTALTERLELELSYDREWAEVEREGRIQGDIWDRHQTNMISQIREILDEEPTPIAPRRPVSRFEELVRKKREGSDAKESEVNEDGIDCQDLFWLITAECIDSEYSAGSAGQWADFQAEYGPADQFDPEAFATRDRVLSVVDEWRVLERVRLRQYCSEDEERLQEKVVRGVDALDVVREIYVSDGSISSKRVARVIGSETSYQGQVTQICTDLAGREWEERPIVTGDKQGWRLTAYGEFLAQTLFEDSISLLMRMFGPEIETDLIRRAAADIGETVEREY